MFDETVGQSEAEEACRAAGFIEHTRKFGASAADQCILFDADEQRMFPSQFKNQFAVDGFDETHVGDGRVEFFRRRQRGLQRRAESQQGDAFAVATHEPFADGQLAE